MRLPQSSSTPFSIRVSIVTAFLLIAGFLPLQARSGQQLQSNPSNIRFGSVAIAQSQSQSAVLTNSGQTSVTISAITPNGAGFSVSGLNLPAVLAAGQTATITVTFAPTRTGWINGSVTVTSTASNSTLEMGLRGIGTSGSALTAAPSSVSFGQVNMGSNSSLSLLLTNSGSSSETLTAFQVVGSSFGVSGPTLPITLNKGQSLTLSVTFTPQSTGLLNGSVFVPGPNLNVPLSGTGSTTTAGQLSVTPSTLSFGSIDIGSTGSQPSTIMATGGSVTVSAASSSSSQFTISGTSFPLTLNSGQSAQVNIIYAPTTSGSASATLTYTTSTSSKSSESLSGTGVSPTYSVSLTWTASTSSVSGYNVYRGTTSGSYTKINTSLDPNTTYTDNTVVAGATYYYSATAVSSSGQESGYSSPIQVSIP
ncbi:MAG TPA: choice-of-anchor D domain-containing protein [Candidatus Acidoferrales bacterium]|nr:choice-of-anchor D domain-containing protein [Candidatus Acidoferrales bacterium]